MPSLTTNYSFNKPIVNSATDQDLWGGYLNDNADSLDTIIFAKADRAVSQTFSGSQKASVTALVSAAASIATDLNLNNYFSHTLTENTTLANPTNTLAGQSGAFFFTQHASSPKTLAYGTNFKFAGGIIPSLTATNGAKDTLYYCVRSATEIEVSLNKGIA